MSELPRPLVSASWLAAHLGQPQLRVLDVRWTLAQGADQAGYQAGHIPGASLVDLDRELASPPGPGGRHPLPDPELFAAAMRRAGVSSEDQVICYDQVTGSAARAWWLLRAAGHQAVAVLDGGLSAWQAAGGRLSSTVEPQPPGDFSAREFSGTVSQTELKELLAGRRLVLDARSRERFAGEPNPLDPRPGHIPGARSLPWTSVYRSSLVVPRDEVRDLVEGPPAAAYCGSGVTACALILALESAGVTGVRLYPGSYSEWAQDQDNPVATGS